MLLKSSKIVILKNFKQFSSRIFRVKLFYSCRTVIFNFKKLKIFVSKQIRKTPVSNFHNSMIYSVGCPGDSHWPDWIIRGQSEWQIIFNQRLKCHQSSARGKCLSFSRKINSLQKLIFILFKSIKINPGIFCRRRILLFLENGSHLRTRSLCLTSCFSGFSLF